MKKKKIALLFVLFSFTLIAQPRLDIDIDSTLKGPIKMITEKQYSSDDLENYRWAYQYYFDKALKITEQHNLNQTTNSFYLQEKFTYDEKGRKHTVSNFDRNGEIFSKDSFVYNKEGELLEKYNFSYSGWSDPVVKLDKYELNDKGQPIAHYFTYSHQEKQLVESFGYDNKGNLTESWKFSQWDTTFTQIEYDDQDRVVKRSRIKIQNGEKGEPCVDLYTYKAEGIKTEQGCRGGLVEEQKRDDNGRVIYESWTYPRKSGEKDYYIIRSTYNDHNLIEKEEWEDNRNREKEVRNFTKFFEFEFDDYGNWVKLTRKKMENDEMEIFMVFEREITYYE